MTRRRRAEDLVVFDVGADGRVVERADGSDDEPGPRRRPVHARRQLVAAGGVLVVGLTAWGVTSALDERERVADVAAAPGGLRSLAEPPVPAWETETDAADEPLFMPGLVVVRRGTTLHAYGLDDGDEHWQVDVGGEPQCAATEPSGPVATAPVYPRLVCLLGPGASGVTTVTVVETDGRATARDLPAEVAAAAPTADGGLVTAWRVGAPPGTPDVHVIGSAERGWDVSGSIDRGQDAVVRLEDAATGAARWQTTVPFRPVRDVGFACADMIAPAEGDGRPEVDAARLALVTYPTFVELRGCGVAQPLTLTGRPATDPTASAWWRVQPYPDGGILERVGAYRDNGVASVLHGPDGAVVATFRAELLSPWATDGTGADVRIAGGPSVRSWAYDEAGGELWRANTGLTDLLVRAAGVAVVATQDGALVGLDLRSGDVLWADEAILRSVSGGGRGWWGADEVVRAAFTDGVRAMLALGTREDRGMRLVAIDLPTGARVWDLPVPDEQPGLLAIDGRLVEVVPRGDVVEVGTGAAGLAAHRVPGLVRVLR